MISTASMNATDTELAGVLAHELGHVAHQHGQNVATVKRLMGYLFLVAPPIVFYMTSNALGAGSILVPIWLLRHLWLKACSRRDEFEADAFAFWTGRDAGYGDSAFFLQHRRGAAIDDLRRQRDLPFWDASDRRQYHEYFRWLPEPIIKICLKMLKLRRKMPYMTFLSTHPRVGTALKP